MSLFTNKTLLITGGTGSFGNVVLNRFLHTDIGKKRFFSRGGKKHPVLGKPVLVMRDTTERPEGIAAGTLKLVGTHEETIYTHFKELLENKDAYDSMAHASNPYGDGFACKRIADILTQ